MERFSVMMVVCLLAGLSECKSGRKDNQTEITMPAIVTTNSPATKPSCEPTIYRVLKELGALEEKLAATVRALEETNKKLEASEKKLEASEKKLSALDSTVTGLSSVHQGQPRVAFSTANPIEDGTIGPVNVLYSLVYRHILSNIGGHYNPITGYFTAPVQGVYYFTFTSFYWGGDGTSGGSLYQNGHRLVSWYGSAPSHPFSGSNSAVLHLQVGDHVNVRLFENRRISDNGNKYSSFSGFLLFPV